MGIEEIDQEHQVMIKGLETLRQALLDGCLDATTAGLLSELRSQANKNFQTEEHLMRDNQFPDVASHREEHRQFIKESHALEETLTSEKVPQRRVALVDHFLSNWLIQHVVGPDRELSRFLHKKWDGDSPSFWRQLKRRFLHFVERVFSQSDTTLHDLLVPWQHSNLLKSYRAQLLISRIRLLAALFAVMTPVWIIFDFLFLPTDLAMKLAGGRMVATVGFLLLALFWEKSDRMAQAYVALGLLFLIPSLFFAMTNLLFASHTLPVDGFSAGLVTGYLFLPFVMAAGISIFPLTVLEGALLALPALLTQIYAMQSTTPLTGSDGSLGIFWLLLLIVAIAILAAVSQLHFWCELVNKTSRDPLTGAYNRAAGQELMDKYFFLARRSDTPLLILFFDLDNFKSVNDLYGHEAGDETLKTMTAALERSTRKVDLVVRWGGEEFLALMPLAEVEDVSTFIRRVCKPNNLGFRPDGKPITASVGVAEFLTDRPSRLSQFIALADQRMYQAKKAGKNRACYGDGKEGMTEVGLFG